MLLGNNRVYKEKEITCTGLRILPQINIYFGTLDWIKPSTRLKLRRARPTWVVLELPCSWHCSAFSSRSFQAGFASQSPSRRELCLSYIKLYYSHFSQLPWWLHESICAWCRDPPWEDWKEMAWKEGCVCVFLNSIFVCMASSSI